MVDYRMTTGFKSFLRNEQARTLFNSIHEDDVKIFAPAWVQQCLDYIGNKLGGAIIAVHESRGGKALNHLRLGRGFSLRDLQILSRNEPHNVTGEIDFRNYPSMGKELVYGLKDLVRQCIIVGKDRTTHYGGYPRFPPVPQSADVYVCDLAGLQFQSEHNSGRLVLIGKKGRFPKGTFDDVIYQNIVGERKKTYEQVAPCQRYVQTKFPPGRGSVFFDTVAYRRFVAKDVVLCGIGLETLIESLMSKASTSALVADEGTCKPPDKPVVFKFLKYGSGFFAGNFGDIIEEHILEGVVDGLEELFENYDVRHIRAVEFPFYTSRPGQEARLKRLKEKHNVDYRFSREDALKSTWPQYVTATTNCADPHAALGNEMHYSSVDAAIATNLASRGDKFCPLVNTKIQMEFVNIKPRKKSSAPGATL